MNAWDLQRGREVVYAEKLERCEGNIEVSLVIFDVTTAG